MDIFDKYMPRGVCPYPECHQRLAKILANNPKNDKREFFFCHLISLLLMIFNVKTCRECLQEFSYFNFFITGKSLT